MAVTAQMYGRAIANFLGGEIAGDAFAVDYLSDTIKCALHITYTFADTHEVWSDVSATEVAATGNYVAGGATLGTKTLTYTQSSGATAWATGTAYVVGDIRRKIADNAHVYICIIAGTSHAVTEPTWPTVAGQTVTDNTVTWAEFGKAYLTMDAADAVWSSSTITAEDAIIYKDTGTPSTSPLIAHVDFGRQQISSSGTFTITWPAQGIINFGMR